MSSAAELPDSESVNPQGPVKSGKGSGLIPWKPGQSGNPGGKTALHFECVRIAREMCPEGLRRAAEIMRQTEDDRAALVAIGMILDRGLGKVKEIKEDGTAARPDLSKLDPEDLAAMRRIALKLADVDATPGQQDTA